MLGKVTFKSNALQYCVTWLLFMASNAFVLLFFFFFTWAEVAYLFLITKNPKVIFLATVKALSHQNIN